MSKILSNVFIFTIGATIGSVVTWKLVKTKYEQIANEEIESVKERFRNRGTNNVTDISSDEEYEPSDEETQKYEDLIAENGYVNYSTKKETNNKVEEKEDDEEMVRPYVISPDEFDENDDYDTVTLTYYSDGVLTDMYDNIIHNVDELVGEDSLTHFGEYEDDSVFVRNDENLTDYEILLDSDNYYDKYPEERK